MTETTGAMRWAVKESFLRYVRVIAAGEIGVVGGASEDGSGAFEWPLGKSSRHGKGRELAFAGSVRFVAHGGFLDVDIRDPALRLSPGGGVLSVAGSEPSGRVEIATIGEATEGAYGWPALVPRLTDAGVAFFGDVYPAGTELAPIGARVRLHS